MISEKIISKIRCSTECKARLMIALDKAAATIQRYLDDNDIMLTTKAATDVMQSVFGVSYDELFEPFRKK